MNKTHEDSVIVSCHVTSKLAQVLLSSKPYIILEHSDYPPKIPVVVLQVESAPMDYLLIEYVTENKYKMGLNT